MIKYGLLAIVVIGFVLLCIFSASVDHAIAQHFYHVNPEGNGSFFQSSLTDFLYRYGDKAGMILGIAAALIFIGSLFYPRLKKWQPAALTLVLTLILGAGLVINVLFKEFWGRPRPKQVIEFGGKHEFRPFYKPNFHTRHDPEKSFPSGHTAMGFYFMTLCFIAKRYQKRWLFWAGCILTVFLGGGLMVTRILQGGHFFTDTLFAALIMWLTALSVDLFLYRKASIYKGGISIVD